MPTIESKKPPKSKLKYILIAVLIIVIIGGAIIIPRYNRYLREKRAAEIRTALEQVRLSVDQYWKNTGSISGINLESIVKEANISEKVLAKWQFVVAWKLADIYTTEMVNKLKDVNTNELVYVSPYRMVMAYATPLNPLGEGTKVWFVGDSNSYHGFGIDNEIDPDWNMMFPNP